MKTCITFAIAKANKANAKAQMAELVDALVSNTSGVTSMPVRSRLWVLGNPHRQRLWGFFVSVPILCSAAPKSKRRLWGCVILMYGSLPGSFDFVGHRYGSGPMRP